MRLAARAAPLARRLHYRPFIMMLSSRSLLLSLAALSGVVAVAPPAAAQPAAAPPLPPFPEAVPEAASPAASAAGELPDARLAPPGQTLSCASCYPPPDYVLPPAGYAPVYVYAQPRPQLRLTDDELELLAGGEISTAQHVAGALLALSPGFGSGQLAQGRWLDKGWIFTGGELASLALVFSSIRTSDSCVHYDRVPPNGDDPAGPGIDCDASSDVDETRLAIGLGAYIGLRIWEIADAISGPSDHNRRVRALRSRIRQETGGVVVAPFLAPAREDGAMAGVAARF